MSYQRNNVVPFPRRHSTGIKSQHSDTADAFADLTAAMVLAKHARGELEPALLAALLQGVGLRVPQ